MNKLIVLIIFLCILSIVVGFLNILNEDHSVLLIDIGFSISFFAGIILLIRNGTFLKSIFFRITLAAISMSIIGILFKIMHWPFSGPIILISFLAILCIYSIHFCKKQKKIFIDYLKLLISYIIFIPRLLMLFHLPYSWEIQYLSEFIFLTFIVYYIISERRNGRLVLN